MLYGVCMKKTPKAAHRLGKVSQPGGRDAVYAGRQRGIVGGAPFHDAAGVPERASLNQRRVRY